MCRPEAMTYSSLINTDGMRVRARVQVLQSIMYHVYVAELVMTCKSNYVPWLWAHSLF